MDDLFNDGLKSAWRELVSLNEERARTEHDVEREYAAARAMADEDLEQAKQATAAHLEEESRSVEEDYRRAIKHARKSFDADAAKTRKAYDIELRIIDEKGDHSRAEAKKQLEEAIWLAETVYEASEDRPEVEYEQNAVLLKTGLEEIESIEAEARQLVRRYRQKQPSSWSVAGDGASAAGDGAPAAGDGAPAAPVEPPAAADSEADSPSPLDPLDARIAVARADFAALRGSFVASLFPGIRLPALFVLLVGGAAAAAAWRDGWQVTNAVKIVPAVAAGVFVVAAVGLYFVARARVRPIVERLRHALSAARRTHGDTAGLIAAERDRAGQALLDRRETDVDGANQKYHPILDEIEQRRAHHVKRIHEKYPKLLQELETRRDEIIEQAEQTRAERGAEISQRQEQDLHSARERWERRTHEFQARYEERWKTLTSTWSEATSRIGRVLDEARSATTAHFRPWSDPNWAGWTPPHQFVPEIQFGRLHVDVNAMPGGVSADERLSIPWPEQFEVPATLAFPNDCSLLLETGDEGAEQAVLTLQTVMFRLLTALPPGKVRFTIVDPVGLGQNFAGFMHLADHLEALVTDRIWTETRHIEQRLADLTDHMENVIQKYLRNEYETIAEYNERAGEIAEPYRFLVIANFPVNFSEPAAKRLASIVNSGARCGVYTLIAMDRRQTIPPGIELSDLRRDSVILEYEQDGRFVLKDEDFETLPLQLDAPPDADFMIPILKTVGEAARDSSRVEVPFDVVAPRPDQLWTADSRSDLRTPLGRMGATALQQLELGRGTSQHVLIAGKTGSGKSTLLNVLITNIALWYSPDEVQLYLVDFKKGVEFKPYATSKLPHARAIAIESDREFGLSVLQRLDQELKRRGDAYRDCGVQDLASFRTANEGVVMPRTLLVIDEFQEFFVEDDRVAQEASLLLDRLVRQGRAFGIHVVLGSQTLGGAYSLAKSTMGQMAVRIALQCSEADSYLILSEDNSAARLLARPGEAIYNDASGRVEGNSPFQIVWLGDDVREQHLARVAQLARERGVEVHEQIVFEGNAPAEIDRNRLLARQLEQPCTERAPVKLQAWLGEAVAIKDPTSATFRQQTGSNLLVVGQREDAAIAMLTTGLVSLAAGHAPPAAGEPAAPPPFTVLDGLAPDSPNAGWLERVAAAIPHEVRAAGRRDIVESLQALAAEIERRQQADHAEVPPLFLVVAGLQRFRDLRQSDDFSFSMDDDGDKPPAADKLFRQILSDGPAVGVHLVIWCDTATNADRALDRASLREFEMRVVFQMSASDSTNLIDTPAANKLGMRHAIFYSEEHGILEKFRPYGPPEPRWLDDAARRLGIEPAAAADVD